ncbi:MAG: PepSY domain-containing protein [Gemmobacter sp.]
MTRSETIHRGRAVSGTLAMLAALSIPAAALALPAVGDRLGTTPDAVTAALAAQSCPAEKFEAERGKIEVKCRDAATGLRWEIYLDPATGTVTRLKQDH